MTDLQALYQAIILDHNRSPKNFREMQDADRSARGRNPVCGDQLTVWLRFDGDVIADVSFLGAGCAISKASASLMTAAIKGKTRAEADQLFEQFRGLVMGQAVTTEGRDALGKLVAFAGVSRFPARVKCASLAWHTMHEALGGHGDEVSTE
jgi:nitrogen fixation NifU-like protein